MLRPFACLLLAALCGCTLIDQRTFNPKAGLPPVIQAPPGPPAQLPLLTIDFSKPNPDYAEALRQAVDAAVARKPDVAFEVATVVPNTGTPADQVSAAETLTPDAREIARAVAEDGVAEDRIQLTARSVPGVTTRQIQVFVR